MYIINKNNYKLKAFLYASNVSVRKMKTASARILVRKSSSAIFKNKNKIKINKMRDFKSIN